VSERCKDSGRTAQSTPSTSVPLNQSVKIHTAKVAVYSEIHKHLKVFWAPRRIFDCQTWRHVQHAVRFKTL